MTREDARAKLLEELYGASQQCFAAQWQDRLEFIVWSRLRGMPWTTAATGIDCERCKDPIEVMGGAEKVMQLASDAGGWFVFPAENTSPEFIDMDYWQRLVAAEWRIAIGIGHRKLIKEKSK